MIFIDKCSKIFYNLNTGYEKKSNSKLICREVSLWCKIPIKYCQHGLGTALSIGR